MDSKPQVTLTRHERNVLTLIRGAKNPIHGYALRMKLGLPSGTMTPLLQKMSSIKAIEEVESELPPRGRPAKICYVITEYGKALLRQTQ